jgi:sodium-dependent dicarboxylate transporter 2/3/5
MGLRNAIMRGAVQWIGLFAGPVLALAAYLALPETYADSAGDAVVFSHAGRATAALAVWMAVWWMTEAIPVFATALLPLAFLPAAGAATIRNAAAPYGHELIYLFMGGFIIALAMQRWNLHKRFAYMTLKLVGTRTHLVVAGFMGITAFLSMWVSNTATTIMMLPIALSVVDLVLTRHTGRSVAETDELAGEAGHNFALCLLLGIAYAASIGGIGTLIGTPPNLFLASFIKNDLGGEVSFVRWMGVGVPLVVVFVPLVWLLLTRVLYPIRVRRMGTEGSFIDAALAEMGALSRGEWSVFVVFVLTAAAWIFRPLLARVEIAGAQPFAGLTDPGIAMIAALALFVIPVDARERVFVIDWKTAAKLPWGILILFGGGLSLASAIRVNGVSEFIGNQVASFSGIPTVLLVVLVVTMMIFLTELTSNTATTAALVPILAAVAPGLGIHPYLLIVPAAIAASCAFMLPVATPPNAIVFGSGFVRIGQMVRAGFWFNVLGIVLITLLAYTIAMRLLGSVAPAAP